MNFLIKSSLLSETVNQKLKHLDEFTLGLLMRTIRCVVLDRLAFWKKPVILKKIKHLITCLVKAAVAQQTSRKGKEQIAVFLSEIILHNSVYSVVEDSLQEWIVHLPDTLLQPEISVQLLNTLLRLGTHRNEQFLDGISRKRGVIGGKFLL